MRLPRFRIRTLMIVVVVLALTFACGREVRREWRAASYYRWRATTNAEDVENLRRSIKDYDEGRLVVKNMTQAEVDRTAVRIRKLIPYQAALARKYDHAARHPWLSVAPDPPAPE